MPATIIVTESQYADLRENGGGLCLSCKVLVEGGVEPDARKYLCEACGKRMVYGIEEALIMGAVDIGE
jgi:hypothetical protein